MLYRYSTRPYRYSTRRHTTFTLRHITGRYRDLTPLHPTLLHWYYTLPHTTGQYLDLTPLHPTLLDRYSTNWHSTCTLRHNACGDTIASPRHTMLYRNSTVLCGTFPSHRSTILHSTMQYHNGALLCVTIAISNYTTTPKRHTTQLYVTVPNTATQRHNKTAPSVSDAGPDEASLCRCCTTTTHAWPIHKQSGRNWHYAIDQIRYIAHSQATCAEPFLKQLHRANEFHISFVCRLAKPLNEQC